VKNEINLKFLLNIKTMKNIFKLSSYLLFATMLSVGFSGCSDPCDDAVCLNGAICDDGDCLCINGYTGTNCEIPPVVDPCANVTCQNGGTCVNGDCVCADGYAGADCSNEVSPASMRITRITVTSFTNSGWDTFPASSPDIFVKVGTGSSCSSNLYNFSSSFYQDAYPGPEYHFVPSSPIVISGPTSPIAICLYDEDISGDDFMSGVYFNPYENGNNFPATRNISTSGFSCTVHFTYYW
jgi:hypothetical protein